MVRKTAIGAGMIGENLTLEEIPLASEKLVLKKEGNWQFPNELSPHLDKGEAIAKAGGEVDSIQPRDTGRPERNAFEKEKLKPAISR